MTREKHIPQIELPLDFPENYETRHMEIANSILKELGRPQKVFIGSFTEDELQEIKARLYENRGQLKESEKKWAEMTDKEKKKEIIKTDLRKEFEFIVLGIFQLRNQKELEKLKEKEKKGLITDQEIERIEEIKIDLTESSYFQASYILANQKNTEYLQSLLGTIGYIANGIEDGGAWKSVERGLLGEVGLYHLLKKHGLSPELAHPKDDATRHIDMRAKDKENNEFVFQVKHTYFSRRPQLLRTEDEINNWEKEELDYQEKMVSPPDEKEETKSRILEMSDKFKRDLKEMKEYCMEQNIRPPLIMLFSLGSIDSHTGELVEEKFEDFDKDFEKKLRE